MEVVGNTDDSNRSKSTCAASSIHSKFTERPLPVSVSEPVLLFCADCNLKEESFWNISYIVILPSLFPVANLFPK